MALAAMVVEQTRDYPKRMKYDPGTDSFSETASDSLGYIKKVPYPYGWLKGYGAPPKRHLDVLLISDGKYALGETVAVKIIGVFVRNDGDNKLLGVPPERAETRYSQLPEKEKELLLKLYPGKYEGEGWFGPDRAEDIIRMFSEHRV